MSNTQKRALFDWGVFLTIHVVLIGGITYAGFQVYGERLGAWVGVSALVAGITSMYLFAKDGPGSTLMKILLGLFVAANAGYIVHNGARSIGIEAFNNAQIKKYEAGIKEASQASSRRIASVIGMSAKDASQLEKMFDSGQSTTAAILAFLEMAFAIVFFSIASRSGEGERVQPKPQEVYIQSKPETREPRRVDPLPKAAPAGESKQESGQGDESPK